MEPYEIETLNRKHVLLNRYDVVSRALWDLLDDIDTYSDMFKPDDLKPYELFYKKVMEKVKERHKYMESDGHDLTLILGDQQP